MAHNRITSPVKLRFFHKKALHLTFLPGRFATLYLSQRGKLFPTGSRSIAFVVVGGVLSLACAASANVTISTAQTQNLTCSGGLCAPTARKAVLNVSDLETMLTSGNVEVTTTGSGVQANDIEVDAPFTWSNTNALALDAYESIAVKQSVSVAGSGGLTLTTNDGGQNGTLSFDSKGSIAFQNLSSPLTINDVAYTLENSVATLAGAILSNPRGAFALASNYDASQDGTYSNCPIDVEFDGTLQGLGNSISNLSIDAKFERHEYTFAAFLGNVDAAGAVENLRLSAINYTGRAVGGLAAGNEGYLFGDEVTGAIDSEHQLAGGLVQENYGMIISSSANVHLKIKCCAKHGAIAGGLVSDNGGGGTIELSHAAGDISGSTGGGGLVGENEGTISQSYATGNVSYGGGLVFINQNTGTISNSYATGAVHGTDDSGGFIQYVPEYTTGTISDSYSTGAVSTGDGGFLCTDDVVDLSNDYWDITTSGTDDGACGENVSGVTRSEE